MATRIFVNLPVKNLQKSIEFFTHLGFTFNPQFTDDKATCMVIGENIFAMLLVEERFKDFTRKEICVISTPGQNLLKIAMEKLNLSARAYDRILKVARTVADLSASPEIKVEHLAEAIQYRSLDREGWSG